MCTDILRLHSRSTRVDVVVEIFDLLPLSPDWQIFGGRVFFRWLLIIGDTDISTMDRPTSRNTDLLRISLMATDRHTVGQHST